MFHIKGYREDGSRIEVVNEVPAFYALFYNKHCMGYFTTIEACKAASEDYMAYPEALEGL